MIYLGDNYRIDKDKLNWILQEKKVVDPAHPLAKSDTPQEKWNDIGYFGRIEKLINHLINHDLLKSNVNTLEDIKTALKHTENHLKIEIMKVSK